MPKLSNDELLGIIDAQERDSLGGENGELANQRSESLKRYFGEPYGDEVEGRSGVISKDLSDAVDWIMPSLMRVFLASDKVVEFDPIGPQDEPQAAQESDYINHVLMKDNQGFLILYDWFKDALLSKNGYVKHYYEEEDEYRTESYSGLSLEEATLLLADESVEVIGQSSDDNFLSLKIRRKKKVKKICVIPVPPEEVMVSSRCRGPVRESPFVSHVTARTRSELIEMGLDRYFVDNLAAWNVNDYTSESIYRDQTSDERTASVSTADRSMDEIEYKEAFLWVDADDDGIAELRRITVVGNRIPDGDEWNQEIDEIPFSSLSPNRMPHRHVGLGLNDELADIARIKTQLLRLTLDNSYLLTNMEWLVNERVNLSDFLTTRPGGVKRVKGMDPVDGSARAVERAPIIQHVLPVLDYMDGVKQNRTGIGPNMMGLDPDTLKQTTEGAARQALSQANLKIEMIARMFAETGMKDLMQALHRLAIKHQDEPREAKLRNQWVPVNPSAWTNRTAMSVSVGLGTGNVDEVRSNLMLMWNLQKDAAQAGIVMPNNVYALAEKLSDNLGFKQQGVFFSDPNSPEVQQFKSQQGQAPNPLAEVEQIKGQFKLQSDQIVAQQKHAMEMHKMEFEQWKFQQQHALDIAKEEIKSMIAGLKIDLGRTGIGAELGGNNAGSA